jgi:DNA-binding MurR/RpiR family transcriptional regulator
LRAAAELLDVDAVDRVAAVIRRCRQVDIYGMSGSGFMALAAAQDLYRLGVNARAWSDPHLGLTSAALLGPDCVAIGISNSGTTQETVEMLTAAKARGALAVALLSNLSSPLAQVADVSIQTFPFEESLRFGRVAASRVQLFVVDFLSMAVVLRDQERASELVSQAVSVIAAHQSGSPRRSPGPSPAAPDRIAKETG